MQLYIESECKESILFVALHPIKNKSVIPMLQLDAIYKAAHVLKEVVRRTDLIYAPQINPESTVYLKPETCNSQDRLKCVVLITRFPNYLMKKRREV